MIGKVFVCVVIMAANEDFEKSLGRIGMRDFLRNKEKYVRCGSRFFKILANLLIVISTQGVSQVVGNFEGNPSKFRDWMKSTEKCVS